MSFTRGNFSLNNLPNTVNVSFQENDIIIDMKSGRKNSENFGSDKNTDNFFDFDSDDLLSELFEKPSTSSTVKNEKSKNGCPNPLCNHKDDSTLESPKLSSIESIDDIIELGKSYHCKNNKFYYSLDLKVMCNLIEPLQNLKNMVGMQSVKKNIINQILYFVQDLKNTSGKDMLHTVLSGPPGVGKTELGKILAKVYKSMGILKKGHVVIATRSDLIGQYLGHTAVKTQKIIDKARGGVLFIDEAYSLGNPEGRDSFSKECIDTINMNLTERRDFLCIIAGYEDDLEKCFFAYNAGLKRRFTFRYNIDLYSPQELKEILLFKIKKEGWDISFSVKKDDPSDVVLKKHQMEQEITNFFINNYKYFPHFGGDIETLFLKCKIQHSKRVMFLKDTDKRVLTLEDIKAGFEMFLKDRQYVEDENYKKMQDSLMMLY